MPGTDGKTVLAKIKSAPRLKVIPVVIFSTSSNPKDLKECYLKGSNGYVIKPMDIQKLQNCIRLLLEYWLLNNRLPALDLILSEPDPA